MAVTAAGAALTVAHRRAQLALRAGLLGDLTRLWPLFDPTDFDTFTAFASAAGALIGASHQHSAGLAAAYYRSFRAAETGSFEGVVTPIPEPPPRDTVRDALRATALLGTLNARRAGRSLEEAKRNGFVRLAGSATSLSLSGGRDTILSAVLRDPRQPRWQRVTSGDPCAFCAMLASRGAVYSQDTVDFEAHDHCGCSAEPAFPGSRLPPASEIFQRQWADSTAGLSGSDALDAFRQSLDGRQAAGDGE